jgi:hypothetical protein
MKIPPVFLKLLQIHQTDIFIFDNNARKHLYFFEVVKYADGGSGKWGENIGFCKESFFIHPPVPEKSKYLSASGRVPPAGKLMEGARVGTIIFFYMKVTK